MRATVIIPTKNRLDALGRCLDALAAQSLERSTFEAIVVEDGVDGPEARALVAAHPLGARYLSVAKGGPGRARNAAMREARGDILVFIGDDIYASASFLERHVEGHARYAAEGDALLGRTDWYPGSPVTPLMRSERLGQFGYARIMRQEADPSNLPFRYCYTSNLSIKRGFLTRHDLWFDEEFTYAMGEDAELAYRACQKGLRIRYEPSAFAHHDHQVSLADARRRAAIRGEVNVLFARKHPEYADLRFLQLTWRGRVRNAARQMAAATLFPALSLIDRSGVDVDRWPIGIGISFVLYAAEIAGMLAAVERTARPHAR